MIREITSKKDWNTILEQVNTYDFYHTFDYHQISCDPDMESPILIVYTHENTIIALPLILRQIPDSDYYDFTSIYGYGGPVYNDFPSNSDIENYQQELLQYFKSKNIVSVFSRLHPYLNRQEEILSNLGDICQLGKVVNIDVSLPLEDSRRAYQKSLKNQVNKLRRTCIVRNAETKSDIHEFIDIYHENMRRLNAKEHYFFKSEYFINFIGKTDFKTDILLVEDIESEQIIAGSMFVKTREFVQFHLSGTRTDYLRMKPSKLFLDEMRIEATNEGFNYFNLGGGLGSKDDSLFEFKSSFSKDFRDFKVWKLIVNNEAYNKLCANTNCEKDASYFPFYRSNQK